MKTDREIEVHPVSPERWADLETLFGPAGAYGGCWCMWFRVRRKEFESSGGRRNKAALKAIVDSGEPPGLLAYVDGEPAGWVSLDPREKFAHLEHSRTLRRIDAQPVWSITCFVIGRRFRRRGLMSALLHAAIEYARERGAQIIEAYPVEPEGGLKGYAGYTGIASTFRKAGFVEAARASNGRAIVRYYIPAQGASAKEGG